MELVNSSILSRVFKVFWQNSSATAFTVEYNNIQYLITAKHLFNDVYPKFTTIGIFKNNGQIEENDVRVYYHKNKLIDIAIIKRVDDKDIGNNTIITLNSNYSLSEECYFLGFPLGLQMEFGNLSQFPFPLVKHGIVSGFFQEKNCNFLLIDGLINPGFSGGPVFSIVQKNQIKVFGVISGYKHFLEKPVDGINAEINNGTRIRQNSGLILAFDIKHAIEILIEKESSDKNNES